MVSRSGKFDLTGFTMGTGKTETYEKNGKKGTFTNYPLSDGKDKPMFFDIPEVDFYCKEGEGLVLIITPDTVPAHAELKAQMDELFEFYKKNAVLPKGTDFEDNYQPIFTEKDDDDNTPGTFTAFIKFTAKIIIKDDEGNTLTPMELNKRRGTAALAVMLPGLYLQPQPGKKPPSCYIRKYCNRVQVLEFGAEGRDTLSEKLQAFKKRKTEAAEAEAAAAAEAEAEGGNESP